MPDNQQQGGTGPNSTPTGNQTTPGVTGQQPATAQTNQSSAGANTNANTQQGTNTSSQPATPVSGAAAPAGGTPAGVGGITIQDSTATLETQLAERSIDDVLKIKKAPEGIVNDYGEGSSIIINSDRLIFNTKRDYLMACGAEGVLITSPKTINLDCDQDLHIFSSAGEVFIGLPNRGQPFDFTNQGLSAGTRTKASPTPDIRYEPLVLGIKLFNWLEDLLSVLSILSVDGAAGSSTMPPQMIENFRMLEARLPEILSDYAYIDGVTHKAPNEFVPTPGLTMPKAPLDNATPGANPAGSTVSGTQPNQTPQTTTDPAAGSNTVTGTETGSTQVSGDSQAQAQQLANVSVDGASVADGAVGQGGGAGSSATTSTLPVFEPTAFVAGTTTNLNVNNIQSKYFYVLEESSTEKRVSVFSKLTLTRVGKSEKVGVNSATKEELLELAIVNAKSNEHDFTNIATSDITYAGNWDFSPIFFSVTTEQYLPPAPQITVQQVSVGLPITYINTGNQSLDIPTNIPQLQFLTGLTGVLGDFLRSLLTSYIPMSHITFVEGGNGVENSLANIQKIAELGIPAVEVDVQVSKDGTPWLFHDTTLDDKTNGTGQLKNLTDIQISALKYKKNTTVGLTKVADVINFVENKSMYVQLDKCSESELTAIEAKCKNTAGKGGLTRLGVKAIAKGKGTYSNGNLSFTPPNIVKSTGIQWMPIIPDGLVGNITTDEVVTKIVDAVKAVQSLGVICALVEAQFNDSDTKLVDATLSYELAKIGTKLLIVAVGGTANTQGASFRGDDQDAWEKMIKSGATAIMTNKPKACAEYLKTLPALAQLTNNNTTSGPKGTIKSKGVETRLYAKDDLASKLLYTYSADSTSIVVQYDVRLWKIEDGGDLISQGTGTGGGGEWIRVSVDKLGQKPKAFCVDQGYSQFVYTRKSFVTIVNN